MSSLRHKKKEGSEFCSKKYECSHCQYQTCFKSHYDDHLISKSHNSKKDAASNKIKPNQCGNCFGEYKSRTSLWRHKQTCNVEQKTPLANNIMNETNSEPKNELLKVVLQNHSELQNIVINQQQQLSTIVEKIGDTNSHNTNSSTNHSNNKTFNIQFFLNEQCKNAIDIKDFITNLDYSSSNLENNCEKDFTERIIKQMKDGFHNYAIEERPIHCSDAKRNKLHIRDKGEWISGMDSQRKMHEIVANMDLHIQKSFRKWVFENPSCLVLDTPAYNKYMKIYPSINGPTSDALEDRCIKIVVNSITDEVIIDKDKFAL